MAVFAHPGGLRPLRDVVAVALGVVGIQALPCTASAVIKHAIGFRE